MQYKPELTLLDVMKSNDDEGKSEYVLFYFDRICDLCFLCNKNEENVFKDVIDFRFFFWTMTIEELDPSYWDFEKETSYLRRTLELALKIYKNLMRFYFNGQRIDLFGYHYSYHPATSLVFPSLNKSDLYWLQKIAENMFELEDFARDMYALRGLRVMIPKEKKNAIRAQTAQGGLARAKSQFGEEKTKFLAAYAEFRNNNRWQGHQWRSRAHAVTMIGRKLNLAAMDKTLAGWAKAYDDQAKAQNKP